MTNTKNLIKNIIATKLDSHLQLDEIPEDQSLLEDGIGLDSISIVNLIVMIEKEFNISFQENEMNLNLFKDIQTLADRIDSKVTQN